MYSFFPSASCNTLLEVYGVPVRLRSAALLRRLITILFFRYVAVLLFLSINDPGSNPVHPDLKTDTLHFALSIQCPGSSNEIEYEML